jgi:hypothetical protein
MAWLIKNNPIDPTTKLAQNNDMLTASMLAVNNTIAI